MWHTSVSIQRKGRVIDDEGRAERLAVQALAGVGGDVEWWIYRDNEAHPGGPKVGHLRVPVTVAENAMIPFGVAEHDAGETGPQRPRTR